MADEKPGKAMFGKTPNMGGKSGKAAVGPAKSKKNGMGARFKMKGGKGK